MRLILANVTINDQVGPSDCTRENYIDVLCTDEHIDQGLGIEAGHLNVLIVTGLRIRRGCTINT